MKVPTVRVVCLKGQDGFSLVELAVVLFVTGLLLQASLAPLGERLNQRRHVDSLAQLREVRQHLRAHWVSHGFLPCPTLLAVSSSTNTGSGAKNTCAVAAGGLPAAALAMVGPIDASGALLDPWDRPLRYQVSQLDVNEANFPNTPDWTTPGELSRVAFTTLQADLSVCREVHSDACQGPMFQSNDLVAVVVSDGRTDFAREQTNRDDDKQFLSAPFSLEPTSGFDDHVIWLSRSELIYHALQAGWLP